MRGWILTLLVLASCGGRVERPVATVNAYDGQLSCGHLKAEYHVNQIRLKELAGERHAATRDNIGMMVASPLFLDLSQTERKEAQTLDDRNRHIKELALGKNCEPFAAESTAKN